VKADIRAVRGHSGFDPKETFDVAVQPAIRLQKGRAFFYATAFKTPHKGAKNFQADDEKPQNLDATFLQTTFRRETQKPVAI
jgi:hypothetical protein